MSTRRFDVEKSMGVREAKARLRHILKVVKQGGTWTITERGRPVARLVPVEVSKLPLADRLARLEERGCLEPLARDAEPLLPPPLPVSGMALKWLLEDRERGH